MNRVTGIGGIFFQAKDPAALQAWYRRHLGIDVQVWSIGSAGSEAFAPGTSSFMVNYRVENLPALLQALRDEGCDVVDKTDDSEYGKFGWVIDPEGNKVELWQPPAGE